MSRACRLPLVTLNCRCSNREDQGGACQRVCEISPSLMKIKNAECSMNITISVFLRQGTLRTIAKAKDLN